jgi:MFS family permease
MSRMNSTASARQTADQERISGEAGERHSRGAAATGVVATLIPARLERLPWGRFHVLVVAALGVTWILDGLEVTLAGSVGAALKSSPALRFSDVEVGLAGSAYLSGAVLGALFFGWLTDRLGRKKLFFITIAVYLSATALTGLAWNGFTFFLFRFLTGAGIGGEYSAINSTIQELIPARFRGHLDLMINGSFWVGAALGALVAVALLNPSLVDPELGWRFAFLTGALIGLVVFAMRMWIPESPRWLAIHGREAEGEAAVAAIEKRFIDGGVVLAPVPESAAIRLRSRSYTPLSQVFDTLFNRYRLRTFVGLTLMIAQAFFYNAIFFTYALVLTKFYGVSAGDVGWYILPFAAGNFLGPVVLGRLFDTHGRRLMISLTYAVSGLLLVVVGVLFERDLLTAVTQTIGWMIVFFVASPAASAAYLTVSETFPIEIRALTIAVFYAIGTGLGGVAAPYVFGKLIESGSRQSIFGGYVFAAILMFAASFIAARYAVAAERKPLEQVATPLSAAS